MYQPLCTSATALELAAAAAQLSHSIAQLAAGREAGAGGALGANGRRGSSGGSGTQEGPEGGFRQWYLGAFADCFAAELEALAEEEAAAPAPAAVLRRCIMGQAPLFPPGYQRLAAADPC